MSNSATKKAKILYVITKSNFGGAQRYVYDLATNLPSEQYDVIVACGGSGLLKDKLEHAGIRTVTIEHFERDIAVMKELGALHELYTLVQTESPDIVHLNSSKAGGLGALVARICGVRSIIFTAHGWPFYEDRGAFSKMLMWLFSYLTTLLAHRVIVVSQHDLEHAHMFGREHALVHINTALPLLSFLARDAARASLFSETTITLHEHDVWFVTMSEHTHNKNLRTLITALAEVKRRGHANFFLTLMGEGEDTEMLRSHVQTCGLSDHVHFAGYVPEARTLLKAFDVFLLPSLKEGLPYGLLEAGAAGLTCVASNVGGIPEIIEDKKAGYLVNPKDPNMIAEALITTLIPDQTMGRALQEHVLKRYPLNEMIAKTISLYEKTDSRDT